MMTRKNETPRLLVGLALAAVFLSFVNPAFAVDDGARAYWKARAGTHVVSVQYLSLDMQAEDSQAFDPSLFIFPNSDSQADLFLASYGYHFTFLGRPSMASVNLMGASAEVDINTGFVPSHFLPSGVETGNTFSQSATGFGDPTVQLDVNLFGTPPLVSTVDLLNYEPTWTIDAALLLAAPIGQYDGDKLVNIGQNRFYSRIALPMKYHFGAFSSGYMTTIELTPSVWLFAQNDNFLGQKLKNDPLWQIEGHVTHDFTRRFSASLDVLYRRGFKSKIDDVEVGDELKIGTIGLTLNFQMNDSIAIRAGYSADVFGASDLHTSVVRLQLVYGWHRLTENIKKLTNGSH
jgi:hypothetical protein